VRRWQEKFKITTDGPRSRERKHPHPLLNVILCAGCGGPMIGGGKDAYVCRHHRTSGCPRPQRISEHIICALLRIVLDDALQTASDLAERAERQVTVQAPSDQALRLAQVQERSRVLAKTVVTMDHLNEDLIRELDDLQGEINRLRDVVADEQAEREAAEELRESLERLRRAPIEQFESLAPDQQLRLYALLFKNVRIGYQGLGPARRWWLEQYETMYSDEPIRVQHPHVARPVPWSAQRGMPALQIEPPAIVATNAAKPDSGRAISAYLGSLRALAGALAAAS
jgi:TolA-binding protein